MIKTLKAMAIALPLAGAALVATPGTANAALPCTADYFCAWINDEFRGTKVSWKYDSANWGTMGDNAESIFNNRAISSTRVDNVQTYHDVNYGNKGVCVNPGEAYDSGMWDNSYSSHQWVHSC